MLRYHGNDPEPIVAPHTEDRALLTFLFPVAQIRWLDRRAAESGNSRAAVVRQIVAEAMHAEAAACSR